MESLLQVNNIDEDSLFWDYSSVVKRLLPGPTHSPRFSFHYTSHGHALLYIHVHTYTRNTHVCAQMTACMNAEGSQQLRTLAT